MPGSPQRFSVNIGWLLKLRWVAVVGQLLTIGGAALLLGIDLLMWPMFVVIGLTVVSNLLLIYWFARHPAAGSDMTPEACNQVLGLVMTMDMLSLTTLLYVSGGPNNPFCLFFFVNVCLSAVLLDRNWAWALNLLSIACFAGLIISYLPVDELELGQAFLPVSELGNISLPQMGLLVAFATCTSVIVYFLTRLTGELRQQELDLRAVNAARSHDEKMEALGTLAAGAAHELATPLTTIALVAKDVEQSIRRSTSNWAADVELIEDVGLIRQQLDRCKTILDRMASHAGETVGEMMRQVSVADLYQDVREGLIEDDKRVTVEFEQDADQSMVDVPVDALSQAIRGLIQNALDASPADGEVNVTIADHNDCLTWAIQDDGPGMTPDVLRRISEPFFTTKQPGKGMGLGVFLARNVVERLGGSVRFRSPIDGKNSTGTVVTVTLPHQQTRPVSESMA